MSPAIPVHPARGSTECPDLRAAVSHADRRRPVPERRVGARELGAGLITESDIEPGRSCGRIADSGWLIAAPMCAGGARRYPFLGIPWVGVACYEPAREHDVRRGGVPC